MRGAISATVAALLCLGAAPAVTAKNVTEAQLRQALATEQSESGHTVGKWAYRRLREANKALSDGNYQDAAVEMDEMEERLNSLNQHEKALMYQTRGLVAGSLGKHRDAASAFVMALSMGALPKGGALHTQYNLAQMYLSVEQYKFAAIVLEDWFAKARNPAPQAHYLMAATFTQLGRFNKAVKHIKQAIVGLKKPAPEPWLQLQLSIYFEIKNYPMVASTLKLLIARFTRKSYWLQLSAVYSEMNQSSRAAAVMELAYNQGLLNTNEELLNLTRWYSSEGVPIKCADVLEKELKAGRIERNLDSLRLLAACLMNAREYERAIEPLGAAAALSEDGVLYVQLGQVHLERQEWKLAIKALQAAFDKGDLKNEGQVWLLLGIANLEAGNRVAARKAFREALKFKKTKKPAQQWLKQVTKPPR